MAITTVAEEDRPHISEVKLRLLDEEREGLLGFASRNELRPIVFIAEEVVAQA